MLYNTFNETKTKILKRCFMSDVYSLTVPKSNDFELQYYYSKDNREYDARIFPPHLHDTLEFYVLVEGDVSFVVENNVYRLLPGDVLVSKPNEIHNCVLNSPSVHKHLCFWFRCEDGFLFDCFLTHPFGEGNLIRPSEENKKKLSALYEELDQAGKKKDRKTQYLCALQFLKILEHDDPLRSQNGLLPKILKDVLDDINQNFKEINSVEYLLDKYFISRSTLTRLFKKYLHSSPKNYLETKRLAYSRTLLKSGVSVFDACIQSGFPDYSNYIRLFKNRFHLTPKQYQIQNQQN